MILDPVSSTEMQAARVLTGAVMVPLLAAPLFRALAPKIRLATLVLYIAGIFGFLVYHAW